MVWEKEEEVVISIVSTIMIRLPSFLLLFSIFTVGCSDIIRSYNKISHQTFDSFREFSDLFVDGNTGRVTQNLVVGIADDSCWSQLQDMPLFRAIEHFAGGNSLHSVSLRKSEFPSYFNFDECVTILSYKKGDSIEEPASVTHNLDYIDFMHWMSEQTRVSITFTNRFPFPINLFYHSESSEPIFQMEIEPDQSIEMSSFLGHIFSANLLPAAPLDLLTLSPLNEINDRSEYRSDGFKHIVDFMVVTGAEYELSPHNRLETCEIITAETLSELSFVLPSSSSSSMENEGEQGVCSNILLRLIEFSHRICHRIWYEKRLGSNYLQPKVVRPVTSSGFELRKLPAKTFEWLSDWYRIKQQQQEQVETSAGPCMNQHVAPSMITHLEPRLKERLEKELRPILEEWYGGELYLTSIYGIRKYINGSVLRMHVDTVRTHVVSAIMNIDQEVERDWPLVILDHEDNEHSVIMEKGDMLLYESAKLLHGRPEPFVGSHYDNIFIHFRPVNEDEWNYDWI